jgi:Pectate lyase superfamily protein
MRFNVIKGSIYLVFCLGLANIVLKQIPVDFEGKNFVLQNNTTMALQDREVIAENIVFPSDGGVINVKHAPYKAKGDGINDDTLAIQRALSAYPNGNKIIYLPKGTYLVSNQLQWPTDKDGKEYKRTILQGQNTSQTIIKLKNNANGFNNSLSPKAVIWTGTAPAQRFRNAIRNLTVNTGTGNRGAIAIQFIANNQGAIRNVTIRSDDSQGIIGLDMSYTNEIGPLLVKNVKIGGFNIGIKTANKVNSQTFEHITLQNQKECGISNYGQVLSIRGLQSQNTVPAICNQNGVVTLLDASLTMTNGASNQPAIKNSSTLFARNITTQGYKIAIQNNSGTRQNAVGPSVSEFVSHPISSVFPTLPKSLNLPIQETPDVSWDALSNWGSPTHFGAFPNDSIDDSTAIQAAIDSGKTTVYFPNGSYIINKTIYIRKNVKRIIGLEASIIGTGIFSFENGNEPVVIIERFDGVGSGIIHASSRTLILSDMGLAASGREASYSNTGTGDLYIEDVVGAPWTFNQQKVWARQINPENNNATHITNNGGILWILGLKTERGGVLVDTQAGAKTEITGGFVYSTSERKTTPMFTNDNSAVSLTVAECNFNGNFFSTLVSETRNDVTKTLNRGDSPQSCNGSIIPLYVGYK